jgi:hypothetical protein
MVHSVGELYVAGQEYDLDDATGERFVILGYAEGELGREILPDEFNALDEGNQQVSV